MAGKLYFPAFSVFVLSHCIIFWQVAILTVVSIVYLQIDWGKMASRIPDIGLVF